MTRSSFRGVGSLPPRPVSSPGRLRQGAPRSREISPPSPRGRRDPAAAERARPRRYDGTSIVSTIKRLYDLPNFLTKRDAWSAPFDWLFEELDEPRTDAPMHLPDAPAPIPRPGGHPWGTDCDDPTRRMRRSIETFESLLGEDAPSRLHACAAAKPHWLHTCEAGTMAEASEWLANATTRWLAM